MEQLLTTKLFIPPTRPVLVSRPRLIEQFSAGLDRKLTLISAPAGFGKTTLLSECAAICERPTAWLSLDEGDNDPKRFLAYFIAALRTIDQRVGGNTLPILESSASPPLELIWTMLINEIATTMPNFIIVLDDYHVIETQEIDKALTFVLANVPRQMHLVIASRADPTLPLPLLRARNQMTEIRADDLRFIPDEVTHFLKEVMGLNLSAENVVALGKRTEGWIVGLQLAALSIQGLRSQDTITSFINNFTSSHRYVLDYLTDEVLQQRPKGTREFLLKTSILDRMSGPLCDAVTGEKDSQDILESLEAANLFIVPLDNERRWYRYHHLFRDLLSKRMIRTSAGPIKELHRQAARWYEENGFIPEAVDHALAAEDYQEAARLVERGARHLLERSELAKLMTWVDALPDEYLQSRPWLCVFHAWALRLTGGQFEDVESRLLTAEQAFNKNPQLQPMGLGSKLAFPEIENHQIMGHIAAIHAYQALYIEEIPRAIELALQALAYKPEGDFVRSSIALALGWAYRFSGDLVAANKVLDEAKLIGLASNNIYLAVAATCRAAHGLVLGGKLHRAYDRYHDALQMTTTEDGGRLPVAGYAYVYLGGIHREWNELETAQRYLVEGIELCKQVGYVLDQVVGFVNLARVRQAQGDWDGAHEAISSAERLSQMMKSYVYVRRWVEDCQVRVWIAEGNLDAASHWAQESGLSTDDELNFMRELEHIILARALSALGREQPRAQLLDDALTLLERLQNIAEISGWTGKEIEILVLQALTLEAKGDIKDAVKVLKKAITLAEPEGYVRIFVDEGPPMKELLHQAAAMGITPDYVSRLLSVFDSEQNVVEKQKLPLQPSLIEPLSKREIEVLGLMALGKTNHEIATELVIAVPTAKKHVSNIIGKLGVTNRTQAVTRARELNLI